MHKNEETFLAALTAVMLFVCMAGMANANLIVNGSFESSNPTGGPGWYNYDQYAPDNTSIPGRTVNGIYLNFMY